MKQIIWILLLHWKMSSVSTIYNIAMMVTIKPPQHLTPFKNDSYFGYSIANLENKVLISAPRADNIGHIYSYDLLTKSIQKLDFGLVRESTPLTNDYWLGATITKGNSFLIICAPRVAHKYESENSSYTSGTCYSYTNTKILKLAEKEIRNKLFNADTDSFGWSVDVDKEGKIMIGGPAISNGRVEVFRKTSDNPEIITNKTATFNFGYSIANGKFLSDNQTTYAISSTYGDIGEGKVFFLNTSHELVYNISSQGIGSGYGAVLCAVQLEGRRTSLLVGAPTFKAKSHEIDRGAVYVYVPNYKTRRQTEKLILKRIITGTTNNGYFGHAIMNIGDLDGDGKDEVAIGAPYEDDGKGAVYLYSGYGLISNKPWIQRIQKEDSRSFGFSLAPLTDTGDPCNGLGIGAPLSNQAFLLKCIPSITTNLSAVFPNLQTREDKQNFQFIACVNITYPEGPKVIKSVLQLKVEISHPDAKLETEADEPDTIIVIELKHRRPSYCYTFKVLTPEDGNYGEMIKYNLSISLKRNPFPQAVLSEMSVRNLNGQLWAADCNITYGQCKPEFSVTTSSTMTNPYVVGMSTEERFMLTLHNYGETAYSTCVVFSVIGAHVLRPPVDCTRVPTTEQVICQLDQTLPNDFDWMIAYIELDTSLATNKHKELTIEWVIYNVCNDKNKNTTGHSTFELKYNVSDININGRSNPSEVHKLTDVDLTMGHQVQHSYSIRNDGPTEYFGAGFEVLIEKQYLDYQVNMFCDCSLIKESKMDDIDKYSYMINSLKKNNDTIVDINFNVPAKTFGKNNVNITSKLILHLIEETKEKSVSTMLMLDTSIAMWIYIVAFLIGLLILMLITFILYKFNCFQRKNKQLLEDLKEHKNREKQAKRGQRNENYSNLDEPHREASL